MQGHLQSIQSSQSKPLGAVQAQQHARTRGNATRSGSRDPNEQDGGDNSAVNSSIDARAARSRQSALKKNSTKRGGAQEPTERAAQLRGANNQQAESTAASPAAADPYHMGQDMQTGTR